MKLVIVDDEPVICSGLLTLVEKNDWGWEVEGVFSDPEEALENCDWDQIQAALMDINMPSIDGLGLVHILRERGYETSVIFITAYARFDYAQKAIGEKAVDYLLKPISRKSLEDALKKAEKIYLDKISREESPEYIRLNLDYLRKKFFSDIIFEERYISGEEKQKKKSLYYLNGKTYGLLEFISKKTKVQLKTQLNELCARETSWYLYGHEYFYVTLFVYDAGREEQIYEVIRQVESIRRSYRLEIGNMEELPVVYQTLMEEMRKYYNDVAENENTVSTVEEEEPMPEDVSLPVRQAIAYINKNLGKPLSLQTIAMEVYLHPTYLSNMFKKQTGYTIINYINRCRIRKAKELLCDPRNKVCWVMEQVGFVNQRYFGKVFKEITGVTPTQYKYEKYLHDRQDS